MSTFNQKNLDAFVEVFSEQSTILVEVLKKHVDKKMDMYEVLDKCALDIVCGNYTLKLFISLQ